MASRPLRSGPSRRQVWRTLAVAALAALCTACTSVPDIWRPPRPRAAAPVLVPAAAYWLPSGAAGPIVVQVDAEASGQLAIYNACRIGKEPFFGLLQAGGRVGHAQPREGSGACHVIVTAGPYEAIIVLALKGVCPLPAVEGRAPAVG